MPITATARDRVRAYTESNMADTVEITRPAQGGLVLDQATGRLSPRPDAVALYAGIARVHRASATGTAGTGAGNIAQRQVVISVPNGAPDARVDDLVQVTAQTDSTLVGSWWRVLGPSSGGIFGECSSYTCDAWDKSSYWSGDG